jgi:ribonuclease T
VLPENDMADPVNKGSQMRRRFRGFLPVVMDLETGGFEARTDALLEIAIVLLDFDSSGDLVTEECHRFHVIPFEGANIEPASLEVTGIDPHHPLRPAIPERDALQRVFREIRQKMSATGCRRAITVAHNAHFDLGFLNAAIERTGIKRSPFHPFSVFDTATLGGIAYGQTVLARMAEAAGMKWDASSAHSAAYDAQQTADLFCRIVNDFRGIYEARVPAGESDEELD